MKKYLSILLVLTVLAGCKEKKKTMKDDDVVTVVDLIDFFPDVKLPIQVSDTGLLAKTSDSLLISLKILHQFMPDSILAKDFGKAANTKVYPIGKTKEKDKETYLFLKAINGVKKVAYIACFDKENKFKKAMPLVRADQDKSTSSYGMLDSKFQITTYYERQDRDNLVFKRNVYLFNAAADDFTLILTEPNEELIETVINPIDTLPKKNKWSGDYSKDKKNFVSIRDSKRPNELLFFVHFEKENGECKGELKGSLSLKENGKAVFKDGGGPCTLDFDFTSNSVTMKEIGGCGNYRDIKCFFEGSYRKKLEAKPKPTAKKK